MIISKGKYTMRYTSSVCTILDGCFNAVVGVVGGAEATAIAQDALRVS